MQQQAVISHQRHRFCQCFDLIGCYERKPQRHQPKAERISQKHSQKTAEAVINTWENYKRCYVPAVKYS